MPRTTHYMGGERGKEKKKKLGREKKNKKKNRRREEKERTRLLGVIDRSSCCNPSSVSVASVRGRGYIMLMLL